jgi:hypothetical protein
MCVDDTTNISDDTDTSIPVPVPIPTAIFNTTLQKHSSSNNTEFPFVMTYIDEQRSLDSVLYCENKSQLQNVTSKKEK